jgi:hypothetical protein
MEQLAQHVDAEQRQDRTLANAKYIYAVDMWTVEKRPGGWYFSTVRAGLVPNLNHPANNTTGIPSVQALFASKRMGLLHELLPSATSRPPRRAGDKRIQVAGDHQRRATTCGTTAARLCH